MRSPVQRGGSDDAYERAIGVEVKEPGGSCSSATATTQRRRDRRRGPLQTVRYLRRAVLAQTGGERLRQEYYAA